MKYGKCIVIGFILSACVIVGCEAIQGTARESQAAAQQASEAMGHQIAALQAEIDRLRAEQADPDVVAELEKAQAEIVALKAKTDVASQKAGEVADDPQAALVGMLPEPYKTYALLGLGGASIVLELLRRKNANEAQARAADAESIVQSIDVARAQNAEFNAAFEKAKPVIAATQSVSASEFVAKVSA